MRTLSLSLLLVSASGPMSGQYGIIPDAAEPQMTCGQDVIRYDGYDYGTVLFGEQCWLAQDLRTTRYSNGDLIPSGLDSLEWEVAGEDGLGASAVYGEGDARCYSGYDKKACDENRSLDKWGRLYNGHAVSDNRGVCPFGWRVPSDADWMELEAFLGMEEMELTDVGRRGDKEGFELKKRSRIREGEPIVWRFGAMEAGMRDGSGAFWHAGDQSYHWSSTRVELEPREEAHGEKMWMRSVLAGVAARGRVERDVQSARQGFSVRCVTWGRSPHPVKIPDPLRLHPDDTVRMGGWLGDLEVDELVEEKEPSTLKELTICQDTNALNFNLEPPLGPLGCIYSYADWNGLPPAPEGVNGVQRINHTHHSLGFLEDKQVAAWTIYELTPDEARSSQFERVDFEVDPFLKTLSLKPDAFVRTGFDRGHLVPARDMGFDATAMAESFYMSNVAAQHPALNRGKWRILEGKVNRLASEGKTLWVYTGALFLDSPKVVGKGVHVPSHFYKLIVHPANTVDAIAFVVPNARLESDLSSYHCSINILEEWTGMDFLPGHPEENEEKADLSQWPIFE